MLTITCQLQLPHFSPRYLSRSYYRYSPGTCGLQTMAFRCSNGIRQGGQLSPLLCNVYTDDPNHHLQATVVGCYVGGASINSRIYADDMVLLAPMVTALQTPLEVCRHMLDLMTLYTTQQKQYVCWSDQSNHRVGTQQESCSEIRNFALSRSFVT